MGEEQRVHPECINASNPYHECVEYCFWKIAEAKERREKEETVSSKKDEELTDTGKGIKRKADNDLDPEGLPQDYPQAQDSENPEDAIAHANDLEDGMTNEDASGVDYTKLTGRQKKLFELRLRRNEARKANQTEILAEKKRDKSLHRSHEAYQNRNGLKTRRKV